MACSLRVCGDGVSFWAVSGQSSCLPHCLTQVLPDGASLSQGGFQHEGLWEVGHLLPPLAHPGFSCFVFGGSTMLSIETAQASGRGSARGFSQHFPNSTSSGSKPMSAVSAMM